MVELPPEESGRLAEAEAGALRRAEAAEAVLAAGKSVTALFDSYAREPCAGAGASLRAAAG
jgi:hypothetical protein